MWGLVSHTPALWEEALTVGPFTNTTFLGPRVPKNYCSAFLTNTGVFILTAFQGAVSQQARKPLYYPNFVLEAEGKQTCIQTLISGSSKVLGSITILKNCFIFLLVTFVACKVKVSFYSVNNKEIGKCNTTL